MFKSYLFLLATFVYSFHVAVSAPVNDSLDAAFSIFEPGYVVGDNTDASEEVDEPVHGEVGVGKSLWWSWQGAPGEHTVTLRPYREGVAVVFVVYQVEPNGDLIEQGSVVCDSMEPRSLRFEAESDQMYLFAVDALSEVSAGWFYFSINQAPEIYAPLMFSVKAGKAFEVPIYISGFPDLVEAEEEGTFLVPTEDGYLLRGNLRNDDEEIQFQLFAENAFGETRQEIKISRETPQPTVTSPASQLGFVGQPFEYIVEFNGVPGYVPESFDVLHLPQGFVAVYEGGQLKIKGVASYPGRLSVGIWVDNPSYGGLLSEITFEFVEPYELQMRPEITSPLSVVAQEGEAFEYTIETSFSVDDFRVVNLPSGLTLNRMTGVISGILNESNDQQWQIEASYSGGKVYGRLNMYVDEFQFAEFQVPPVLAAYSGIPFAYQIKASSAVDDFQASGLPPWLSLGHETGWLTGIPVFEDAFDGTLFARNVGSGEDLEIHLAIQVLDGETQARITSPAQSSGVTGRFLQYNVAGFPELPSDWPVSAESLPSGLSYDAQANRIVGVPRDSGLQTAYLQYGQNQFLIQFDVTDPVGGPDFLNAAVARGVEDEFFYFPLNASGAQNYQVVSGVLPDGLLLNSASGVISGMPFESGSFELTLRAAGVSGHSESFLRIEISGITETEIELILSPGQIKGEVGETLVYMIGSTESGGNFNSSSLPPGLIFDPLYGIIYGAPLFPLTDTIRVEYGEAYADVLLTVEAAAADTRLLVTSAPSAAGEAGDWFEFQIETNAAVGGIDNLQFIPDSSWPDSLTLDEGTGRVYGYLGEDWAPQLGFNIYYSGGQTDSSLSIIGKSNLEGLLPSGSGHIVGFPGDFIDHQIELNDPSLEVYENHNNTGLFFDENAKRLYGYLGDSGNYRFIFEVVHPENNSRRLDVELSFQVLGAYEKPQPILTSALAPVAKAGEWFSYTFEFDRPVSEMYIYHISEPWLERSGPFEVSGWVPEGFTHGSVFIYGEFWGESFHSDRQFELVINVSDEDSAPIVKSPASAMAFLNMPFTYKLEIADLESDDNVSVNAPGWLIFDPNTLILSGVLTSTGQDQVGLGVDTSNGRFDSTLNLLVTDYLPRPYAEVYTPVPLFRNLPYELPIRLSEFVEVSVISSSGEDDFIYDSRLRKIIASTENLHGDQWIDMSLWNPSESTHLQFNIPAPEVAPFVLKDPVSMTSFIGANALFAGEYVGDVQHAWYSPTTSFLSGSEWLELKDVKLSDQGDYYWRLRNAIGEAYSQPARLTLGAPSRLRDWTIAYVGELYLLQSGGLPQESWMNDGVANLLKWATGLPLTETATGAVTEGSLIDGAMEFRFDRNVDAEDVSLTVERSQTLTPDSWVSAAI